MRNRAEKEALNRELSQYSRGKKLNKHAAKSSCLSLIKNTSSSSNASNFYYKWKRDARTTINLPAAKGERGNAGLSSQPDRLNWYWISFNGEISFAAHTSPIFPLGFVYNRRWLQYHPQQLSLSVSHTFNGFVFSAPPYKRNASEISCAPHASYIVSIWMNGCSRRRTDYKAKPAALHFW